MIEINDFHNQPIARFDPLQGLPLSVNGSVHVLQEIVRDGCDGGVVIGRRQLSRQQTTVSKRTLSELIGVISGDDVAPGDLQNIIVRKCQNVIFGRDEDLIIFPGDFHMVNRDGLAQKLVNHKFHVTQLHWLKFHRPFGATKIAANRGTQLC